MLGWVNDEKIFIFVWSIPMHANSLLIWNESFLLLVLYTIFFLFAFLFLNSVYMLEIWLTLTSLWLKCESVWETCNLACLTKLVVTHVGAFWRRAASLSRRTTSEPSSRQPCPPLCCQHAISLRLSASRHLWESCHRVPHRSLQTPVWTASPGPSPRWPHFCRLLEPKGPQAWRRERMVGFFKILSCSKHLVTSEIFL